MMSVLKGALWSRASLVERGSCEWEATEYNAVVRDDEAEFEDC